MECSGEIRKLVQAKCVDIFRCKVLEECNITLSETGRGLFTCTLQREEENSWDIAECLEHTDHTGIS